MRQQHRIPTACPTHTRGVVVRADGFVPAKVAARQLGITLGALRIWAPRGVLACDQSSEAAKLWIRLDPGDVKRLGGQADAAGMERVRDVASRNATPIASVWERVRKGEFYAYRLQTGSRRWEWGSGSSGTETAIHSAVGQGTALSALGQRQRCVRFDAAQRDV